MKSSLVVSAGIAIGIALLGWRENHHAATLRLENQQLRSQAADLGISESNAGPPQGKRSKRSRDDHEAQTMDCFRKLVSIMKEVDQSDDGEEDPALQAEMIEAIDLLYRLDGSQVRALIEALQKSPDIDDDMKEGAIGASVMILGNHHPSSAAAIFTDSPGLLEDSGVRSFMVDSVVIQWGEQDPLAAFKWIRAHQAENPELITDGTVSSLISGTAARNPKLAFQFIKDLGIKDPHGAIYNLGSTARNADQRDALMEALKEVNDSIPDADREGFTAQTLLPAVNAMAEPLISEGFEAASSWMESAGLDEQAKVAISGELSYSETRQETGRWIDWLAGNLTSRMRDSKITDLMESWTRADHRAAGSWLAASAESPGRQAAVLAYARTVAKYDPETAARWADTVADPDDRAELLRRIQKTRENR